MEMENDVSSTGFLVAFVVFCKMEMENDVSSTGFRSLRGFLRCVVSTFRKIRRKCYTRSVLHANSVEQESPHWNMRGIRNSAVQNGDGKRRIVHRLAGRLRGFLQNGDGKRSIAHRLPGRLRGFLQNGDGKRRIVHRLPGRLRGFLRCVVSTFRKIRRKCYTRSVLGSNKNHCIGKWG